MTPEEIAAMQEENRSLKALVAELLPLREVVSHQALLIAQLQQQVQALQEGQGKDSHTSHLPPSSDRFVRQPKSPWKLLTSCPTLPAPVCMMAGAPTSTTLVSMPSASCICCAS